MSTPQEQPNVTVTPVPDVNLVSDGEDKEIVNLEAVARLVKVKLDKDLVEAKVRNQNEGIMQKKQEWVNHQAVAKNKKEDKEAAEVPQKVDEEAKKKVLVLPLVSFFCLSSLVAWKLTWFPVWASCSTRERNSRAIQA